MKKRFLKKQVEKDKNIIGKIERSFLAATEEYMKEKKSKGNKISLVPIIKKDDHIKITESSLEIQLPDKDIKIKKKLIWFEETLELTAEQRDEILYSRKLPTYITSPIVRSLAEKQERFLLNGSSEDHNETLSNIGGARKLKVSSTESCEDKTQWQYKSGKEIVTDILTAVKTFEEESKNKVNVIAFSTALFELIKIKETVDGTSVLKDLQDKFPHIIFGENTNLLDEEGNETVVLLDKNPNFYGFLEVARVKLSGFTKNSKGGMNISFGGNLSELITVKPEAIMFLRGIV